MSKHLVIMVWALILLITTGSFLGGYAVRDAGGYYRCAQDCTKMFNEACEPRSPITGNTPFNVTKWLNDGNYTNTDQNK